jgi:hypothetical protein
MSDLRTTSRHRRLRFTVLSAVACSTALLAGPAAAEQTTVTDGQDEPASVDITSVTYDNGETTARSDVSVRALDDGDIGRVVTRIGPPGTDAFYEAMLRLKSDDTLVTRLTYVTDTGRDPVDCDFAASWSTSDDEVITEIPHTCLDFGHFQTRLYFQATMYRGSDSDEADSAVVGRGDSPGCATKGEMAQVHQGDKKFRVHQLLDTAGKYGDAGAGSYARTYRACDDGARWFVQYSADADTVVNKGRVS